MSTCWDTKDRIKKVPKTIEKRRDKIEKWNSWKCVRWDPIGNWSITKGGGPGCDECGVLIGCHIIRVCRPHPDNHDVVS